MAPPANKSSSNPSGRGKRPAKGAPSTKGPKDRSPARARRAAPPPPEPVASGRLVWVIALLAAMVMIPLTPLSSVIAKKPPEVTKREAWQIGNEGTVHITLITADYDKLACASADKVGEYHCAYEDDKKVWPRDPNAPADDNKKHVIQPYRTADGQLILIGGLWAQPAVAMRLHNEPYRGVAEKKLARFVVECRVKFLEQWKQPKIRWSPGSRWDQQGDAPVAEPLECHMLKADDAES